MAEKAVVRFHGRVYPESTPVPVYYTTGVHWQADELGYVVDIVCRVNKSVIDIECTLSEWKVEYYSDLYRRALDVCRATIDIVGFKMAYGLTVLLDTFQAPDGTVTPIKLEAPYLEGICTAFSLEKGFDEVCKQVLQQPLLFMAIHELIMSISLPHVSLVECARAMDRIKNLLSPPGSGDKVAWTRMRETLRVDMAYLKYITDASTNPRHGHSGHVSGSVTTEVTRRAWVIMNRYLEYILNEKKPLDPVAYPILHQ
ncbi:hypothetical protein [Chromobacterium haemolyticum]|uniref:hypothetical protein n=1 Tax=Chromobacterium haemolyticum TaxID=394935 RepID=UPI00174655C7|nr:hypothetical protein [Chromobacterium haemolyticum]QOD82216.1 hypothetical protein IEZ30_20440 [Chromobacterium haemolyticum]